jgi:hypothetical protein
VRRLGEWTLLLVLAGASCSGASNAPGDGGSSQGGSSGAGGSGAAGGAGGSGGSAGSAGGGAGTVGSGGAGGTSGTSGGPAGRGGWGSGGIDPSCVRPDAQLNRFLNLDIRGEAFPDEHRLEYVYVVTKNASSGIIAAGRATVGSAFTLHLEGGYERNTVQQIAWFADADGDGRCYSSDGDHFGYIMVGPFDPAGNDAYSVTFRHNDVAGIPGEANPCVGSRPFGDMAGIGLRATGFEAHERATFYALARNPLNGFVFGRGQYPFLSGQFGLHLPRAYARNLAEEIFWFVDADGDGLCTSADHRGYAVTPIVATEVDQVNVDITDNHTNETPKGVDVCVVLNGCPVAP